MRKSNHDTSSARRRQACGPWTGPSVHHRFAGTMCVAVLATLSGCASLAPPLNPIAPPVASNWPKQPDTPGVAAASELTWREYFTDPALQALMETALENNRDLRAAALRTEEARAAFHIQCAQQAPMDGVGAQQTRAGLPDALQPLAGRPVLEANVASVGISSWELDLWGRVPSMKTAALEQWLATEQGRSAVALALVAQVADAPCGDPAPASSRRTQRSLLAGKSLRHTGRLGPRARSRLRHGQPRTAAAGACHARALLPGGAAQTGAADGR